MKKLARKLSVFALSSVILLANSPIKAGMFAEGQTYDLGEVGEITINYHQELCDDREYFIFIKDNNKVCVEVGADEYEVTVYNSAGDQLLHTYEQKTEKITKTLVLGILATTLTELAGIKLTEVIVEDKPSPRQQSTKKPKRTTQDSPKSKKLAKPGDFTEETSEKSCIAKRTRRQTKLQKENTSEIISPEGQTDPSSEMPRRITRSLSSLKQLPAYADDDQNDIPEKRKVRETCTVSKKTKTKKTDKHVEEKKPKKANQTGHCACEQPDRSRRMKEFEAKIGEQNVCFAFYHCLKCKRPIRQSREQNKSCCWKTYCTECGHTTEFYMRHGTGEKCILRCCQVFPFELHEIEYANTAEFNAAVDRGQIKYICSKNPNHIRGHARKTDATRGTQCLDCMNEANATRRGKKITLLFD